MPLHKALEYGYFPDWLVRLGIRRWLAQHPEWPEWIAKTDPNATNAPSSAWFAGFLQPPFSAAHPQSLHQELDELSGAFFQKILGPHLLYSAGWWAKEVNDLETAEAAMLALSCERAQLDFDQDILEVGDGWGALALWLAKFYPDSRIVAVADSPLQHAFITACRNERRLNNLRIIMDFNDLPADQRFDRVLSTENLTPLADDQNRLARLARRLNPGGKLFMQTVDFQKPGAGSASGKTLNDRQPPGTETPLQLEEQWHFPGYHYQRTLQAWLANQDRQRNAILRSFRELHGAVKAAHRFQRWRLLFLIHAELFGYGNGEFFGISQLRFGNPG